MIYDLTTFESGELRIPGLKRTANNAEYRDGIIDFLDNKEREVLIDGLGYSLYNEVKDSMSDLENAPQEIQDLVKGLDYDVNGLTVRWEGIQDKYSFLSYYLYAEYVRTNVDVFTTLGVQKPEAINAEASTNNYRYAEAYRKFFEKYQGQDLYPRVIRSHFGIGVDWYGSQNTIRSLYQFLNDRDYSNAQIKLKENTNSWGV